MYHMLLKPGVLYKLSDMFDRNNARLQGRLERLGLLALPLAPAQAVNICAKRQACQSVRHQALRMSILVPAAIQHSTQLQFITGFRL